MHTYLKKSGAALLVFSILGIQIGLVGVPTAHAAVSNWIKAASFIPSSSGDFAGGDFQQSVRNFKAAGGNYVNLVIPYYQSNPYSTDIGPGYNTPTDQALIAGIQYVHAQGLHVQLSVYLENYSGEWRALINPGDRNTWYQKYGDVLVHYGQIGGQQGVELYELGAELIDMASASQNTDNTQRWVGMISRVRGVYSGALTYSANRGQQNWASELPNIGFWDKLNYIGVSAYYELPGDGSVASLKSDWQNANNYDIAPITQRWGKPVLFTEVGYKSVSGAHNTPWDSGMGGPYDPQEQVNDYQALMEYWNNYSYMQGVDWWWWSPNPNYGGSGNTDYTPQNKPAQDTLKSWWLGSQTGPTTPPPTTGTPAFTATGNANPTAPGVGQATTLGASIADSGGATTGTVVDLEVYSNSSRVFQQFSSGQNFAGGQTLQYTANWTAGSAGDYTLKIGVFNSDWSQDYIWNDSAAVIHVGASGGGTPPPSTSVVTDVWWPADGSHVTGVQPFKAMLENMDVSQYSMYWQVDGGTLVPMQSNPEGWPHKEALVDLSGWNWKGAGPYTLTFVSKNPGGSTISQKSVQIWTQ